MKTIELILTNKSSHIENEDYFPLRVIYEASSENIQHIGFYYGDEDLLELCVAKDTGMLQRLQMTLCHHYSVIDNDYDIEGVVTTVEDIILELPDHNECGVFDMHIYNNCAVITLSEEIPAKLVKCGQVVFGINEDQNSILSIIVTGLAKETIDHITNELSLQ